MLAYLAYIYVRHGATMRAYQMTTDAPKSYSYAVGYFFVWLIYLIGRLHVFENAEGDEEKMSNWADCVFEYWDGYDTSSYTVECDEFPPGRSPVWAVLLSTVVSAGQSLWVVYFLNGHIPRIRSRNDFLGVVGDMLGLDEVKITPITSSTCAESGNDTQPIDTINAEAISEFAMSVLSKRNDKSDCGEMVELVTPQPKAI